MANKSIGLMLTSDSDPKNKLGVPVTIAGKKWGKADPIGPQKSPILKSAEGVWTQAAQTIHLKSSGKTVASLSPIVAKTATMGETGSGIATETGIAFTWVITVTN
jgi:hypothetical protein